MRRGNTTKQRGMALIIALTFLLIMTLLGISGMQSSIMEERMTGNAHDHNMAFQSAESGLRDAGIWLLSITAQPTPNDTGSNGIYSEGTISTAPTDYTFNWDTLGTDYGTNTSSLASDFPQNSKVSKYVIEETTFIPDNLNPESRAKKIGVFYYQISAIGYGGTDTSESVTQSVYEKRFN